MEMTRDSSTGEGPRLGGDGRRVPAVEHVGTSMRDGRRDVDDDVDGAEDANAERARRETGVDVRRGRRGRGRGRDDDDDDDDGVEDGDDDDAWVSDAMRRARDDMREVREERERNTGDAFARAQYDARRARRGVEVKTTPPSASESIRGVWR